MLAKRNASGHVVNCSTRLGDKLVGTSNMRPSYGGGVSPTWRGLPSRSAAAVGSALMGRGRNCAAVVEELLKRVMGAVGDAVDGACRELGGNRLGFRDGSGAGNPAQIQSVLSFGIGPIGHEMKDRTRRATNPAQFADTGDRVGRPHPPPPFMSSSTPVVGCIWMLSST